MIAALRQPITGETDILLKTLKPHIIDYVAFKIMVLDKSECTSYNRE